LMSGGSVWLYEDAEHRHTAMASVRIFMGGFYDERR